MGIIFVHLVVWFGLPLGVLYLIGYGIIQLFDSYEKGEKKNNEKEDKQNRNN